MASTKHDLLQDNPMNFNVTKRNSIFKLSYLYDKSNFFCKKITLFNSLLMKRVFYNNCIK